MVVPNYFGKHVNSTSQIKNSNIEENKMLLEKGKLLSKEKDVGLIFRKHIGSITHSSYLFNWPEDASVSTGNDTINFIIKKFVFQQNKKPVIKVQN